MRPLLLFVSFIFISIASNAQNSIARDWNNIILEAIRNDFARPTVHARNLYHHSIIAYDAWAAYDNSKERFFLGDTLHGYVCLFDGVDIPANIDEARKEAISYASYRFLENRYSNSPDYSTTLILMNNLMNQLGYDMSITSTDYINGGPAELGNYLAEQIQLYGLNDGSNEQNDYANIFYDQLNPPIIMSQPGNPDIQDPNHWQPITLTQSIDQSGNPVQSTPPHLSPEWGEVDPFSLDSTMYNERTRDGDSYKVYFDTVYPAFLDLDDSSAWDNFYKWNHTLVSIWQSHLDPTDGVLWDISPASMGNNTWYPSDSTQYPAFYDLINGGDPGTGYTLNPVTGLPYTPQVVPRGDYARVLAEFWADGIDSETPPGHWFEIYHYVTDQPAFEYKWQGIGPTIDKLEYDVKAHLTLGGTMHDAAISAWSLKGYYDYIRPVSAIRHMADLGQSSDTTAMSYHPNGIPLLPGYVELVQIGDTLAGQWNEHVGKIKLFTWKGHEYISDPLTEVSGVGWILAENWWPYQRPTFVTPPFAGFVSGHSTFSRAAANTMEFMTGSPYFPGGLGEFQAVQNQYLHFEDGPSVTITLQWASYKDAADQCSLSRLWGGIHPPIDDIPGRLIGEQIGSLAFAKANALFDVSHASIINVTSSDSIISRADISGQFTMDFEFNVAMDTSITPVFNLVGTLNTAIGMNQVNWVDSFNLELTLDVLSSSTELFETGIELTNLVSGSGVTLMDYSFANFFVVDTKKPTLLSVSPSTTVVNDALSGLDLTLNISFDERCDTTNLPVVDFVSPGLVNSTFNINGANSEWVTDTNYSIAFTITDYDETILDIIVETSNIFDAVGNEMDTVSTGGLFIVDTESPSFFDVTITDTLINENDLLSPVLNAQIEFTEQMDTTSIPTIEFYDQGNLYNTIVQNVGQTVWTDTNILSTEFLIFNNTNDLLPLDLVISNIRDDNQNIMHDTTEVSALWSDLKAPEAISYVANKSVICDSLVGSGAYYIDVLYSEPMDTTVKPLITHFASQPLTNSVQYNLPLSHYVDSTWYRAYFQVIDEGIEIDTVDLYLNFAVDRSGNTQLEDTILQFTTLDTKNPNLISVTANDYILDQIGQPFDVLMIFDEAMLGSKHPELNYTPILHSYVSVTDSMWINPTTYSKNYELINSPSTSIGFDLQLVNAVDLAGNLMGESNFSSFVQIDPALGIDQLGGKELIIYPNVLRSGNQFTIQGELSNENSFVVLNSIGQKVKTIELTHISGEKWKSEPLHLSAGLYFLSNTKHQIKLIVR